MFHCDFVGIILSLQNYCCCPANAIWELSGQSTILGENQKIKSKKKRKKRRISELNGMIDFYEAN